MPTVNVTLSDELRSFVDRQVVERGLESCSDYIGDLVGRERDRQQLREMLLEGLESPPGPIADEAYFKRLRAIAADGGGNE